MPLGLNERDNQLEQTDQRHLGKETLDGDAIRLTCESVCAALDLESVKERLSQGGPTLFKSGG